MINEAIRIYLARPTTLHTSSLRLLRPEPYPPGNNRLSMDIDELVYGSEQ